MTATASRFIDLNADLGEGYGIYSFGHDDALLEVVTSANIACGFHAGDPQTMRRTVEKCIKKGIAIGVHPGLPDRLGFGRREMTASPDEIADWTTYQIGALGAFVTANGGQLHHVKPHGAMYHMIDADYEKAEAFVRAVAAWNRDLFLYGPSGGNMEKAAHAYGLTFAAEAFADRSYLPNGKLAPRGMKGAVIENRDEAVRQALLLAAKGQAFCVETGAPVSIVADTLCVHGDGPHAVQLAIAVKTALESEGISLVFPRK